MKKVVLLSTAVVLFGFSTAFALSEDVERDKFLGTLGARSEMVSSINSNALDQITDIATGKDTKEEFAEGLEQGCYYANETVKVLSWVQEDLQSKRAQKWVKHRVSAFKFASRANSIGNHIASLCKQGQLSNVLEIKKMLEKQRGFLNSLSGIL
jgi:hypothetical protein